MSLALYWWRPFDTVLNAAVSLRRYSRSWWEMVRRHPSFTNFGDSVNEHVMSELSGRKVRWAPLGRAEVIGIGSVVDLVERSRFDGVIFGSGVRDPQLVPHRSLEQTILVARGTETARILGRTGAVPLGDPGLLVREVFGRPSARVGRAPVLVPHFGVLSDASARGTISRFAAAGWNVVLPNLPAREIAHAIASAPVVASSSLHGLVFAHSYGVPTAFVDFEHSGRPEPVFKYADYYSVFGIAPRARNVADVLNSSTASLISAQQEEQSAVAERLDDIICGLYQAAKPLRSGG